MCSICGCQDYVRQGEEAALRRAVAIIQKLGVTPENVALFEDGEYICGLLGPRMSVEPPEAEVWDIVRWLNRAHESVNEARNRAAVAAAQDVFRRFPSKGPPKETLMLWHQLEQLERELRSEALLSAANPSVRGALEAVRHVHDSGAERVRELRERYGLP